MIKKMPLVVSGIIFVGAFFYLHQKVQTYVQAYQLNKNYQQYNELVDKRDYLMYNFTRDTSLPKINQWAESNGLSLVEQEKKLVLNLRDEKFPGSENKFDSLFSRFLRVPSASSTALAEEKQ